MYINIVILQLLMVPSSPFEDRTIRSCPEMSVINNHSALREIPKERRYKIYLPINLCERESAGQVKPN